MGDFKLSFKWLLYLLGLFGNLLISNAILTMLLYRYDPVIPNSNELPFLVSSAFVGVAMLISRTGNALAQPLVGYFSDRLQSQWGRRRPFLAIAVLPLVFCFILLFSPPIGKSNLVNFLYLLLVLCLFDLAAAVYVIPYQAWLPTLAPTDKERLNLSTLRAFFGFLGSAIGAVGAPWLTHQYGFHHMAIIIGCVGFVTLLMPLAITEDITPSPTMSSELPPTFWKSIQSTWRNHSFRFYLAGTAGASIAVSILSACPTFLAVALLHRDLSFGAVVGGTSLGSAMLGLTLVIPLAKRLGKSTTFQWSMIWFGTGLLLGGIWPFVVGTALMPWLGLILISNLAVASLLSLPSAMLPDVIAQESVVLGIQQEAIYYGLRGFIFQTSQGIGSLLVGIILMLGKTPEQPWGVQLAFPIAAVFALVAAWSFACYPIKK
ncbi:MAG: MFS transporter [Symploca sp. SIO2D2]|nr:MFS transporter [Symploca sp. SIO2D2]